MITLHGYQAKASAELAAALGTPQRALLVLPTGGGKTTVAADVVAKAVAAGMGVLFLAHRTELIDQAANRLRSFGVAPGLIKAGRQPNPEAVVQVASIQTLTARRARPPAALVVVDEAHRCKAASYQAILDAYPDATVIGLTATPIRLDGQGLGDIFSAIIEAASVTELLEMGVLVPAKVYAPTTPDLTGVRTVAGDFHVGQLAEACDKPHLVGDVVTHWQRLAGGRRTVVFAASVEHSRHLCEAFTSAAVAAAHIDGETTAAERASILAALEAGELTVVCNYGVLTEGWDCCPVEVCVLARPTKSLGAYLQMVGRVLRAAPGKAEALVLDHAGATLAHGFATDARAWTLDKTKRKDPAPSVKTCPMCFACAPGDAACCPLCGEVWPAPKPTLRDLKLRIRGGELVELTPEELKGRNDKATPWYWRRTHPVACGGRNQVGHQILMLQELREHAKSAGYKPKWPEKMFQMATGRWPDKRVLGVADLLEETKARMRRVSQ